LNLLTLDIGGTKTAAAWWQAGQRVLRRELPTPGHANDLLPLIGRLVEGAPAVQRVGAAITGTTDGRRVGALNRHMMAGWDGFALADRLEALLDVPAVLLNDAQAAAWGEYGVRRDGVRDLMFVTVSTGLGAGLVLDGRLRTGMSGLAGHLGHTVAGTAPSGAMATPAGWACSCGRLGCLERRASGTALQQDLAAQGLGDREARQWLSEPHSHQDALAQWVGQATQALAQAIGDAQALLDLQCVLLGGGLGLNPRFFAALQEAIVQLPVRFQVPLAQAQLGADAGLAGMARWLQADDGT
jgi:N-acylmannosamine kinase